MDIIALFKSLFAAIANFLQWKANNDLREDGANEAELRSIKRERKKVDDAIAAGNNPSVRNDPQDRANRRKA